MTVPLGWLTIVIGTVLPMAVALVSHQLASSRFKAIVLVVLSAVSGVGTQMLHDNGHLVLSSASVLAVVSFVLAYVAHAGLLKPLGLTGSAGLIAQKVPGGLGAAPAVKQPTMGAEG